MAVARELSFAGLTRADVHLVVGLPMTWVRSQRESFRVYLMRKADVQFSYGGKTYRIHFVGCTVYPQLDGEAGCKPVRHHRAERRHGQLRREDRRFDH